MSKPKTYTMFVSFSAMDMEQAVEYIHDLDDKDIRSCLEEEQEGTMEKSHSWLDMANLTHETQVMEFNFCLCEEQEQFPYEDCPKER